MTDDAKSSIAGLETAVHQAAATIAALRKEKAKLVRRVETLEARAGAAGEAEAERAEPEAGGGEQAAAAWRKERREIRKRVEKLTKRLEGLLEEP